MTSKVQQAKDAQGYIKGSKQCQNCHFFDSEKTIEPHPYYGAVMKVYKEKNRRCTLGDFAVQLTASCDRYHKKEAK